MNRELWVLDREDHKYGNITVLAGESESLIIAHDGVYLEQPVKLGYKYTGGRVEYNGVVYISQYGGPDGEVVNGVMSISNEGIDGIVEDYGAEFATDMLSMDYSVYTE